MRAQCEICDCKIGEGWCQTCSGWLSRANANAERQRRRYARRRAGLVRVEAWVPAEAEDAVRRAIDQAMKGGDIVDTLIREAEARLVDRACLAVSERAGWPEDEHGRTEQPALFARVINAIRAEAAPRLQAQVDKAVKDAAETVERIKGDGKG